MNFEEILQGHPVVLGLIVLSTVLGIFSFLGFDQEELKLIAFLVIIILVIIYFDKRIQKIEKYIGEINISEGMTMLKNKKGLTQFAWFLILALIGILIWYLWGK